ncbi:MAG: FliH/SctL family protein [Micropepsaceae bacterium]
MQPLRTVKFNFDNVFGAKDTGAQAAAPRARSSYSADEVELIRKESQSKGKADAEAAALALQAQTLGAIAHSLTTVISQFGATVTAMRQESAQLALAVGRKLAEHALTAYPLEEVQTLLADCLHKMHDEPRIVVRLAPDGAEAIRAEIDRLCEQHGFAGRVVVIAEPVFSGADCRIEWADGGIERDMSATFAAIEQCAERWRATTSAEET